MNPSLKESLDAVLYAAGALEELHRAGLVTGTIRKATPRVMAAFDQLHATGYRPTKDQIGRALVLVLRGKAIRFTDHAQLIDWIANWQDAIELNGYREPDAPCDCSVCENRRGPDWRFYVQFAGIGVVVLVIVVLAVLALIG